MVLNFEGSNSFGLDFLLDFIVEGLDFPVDVFLIGFVLLDKV